MAKYSLAMTATPCRVDACIISISLRHSCTCLLTYLLTQYCTDSTLQRLRAVCAAIARLLFSVVKSYFLCYDCSNCNCNDE